MGTEAVYRATDPTIMESARAWRERAKQWQAECLVFAAKYAAEFGRTDVSPVSTAYANGSRHLTGLTHDGSSQVPTGWRLVMGSQRSPDCLVPVRRSKTGKVVGAQMDALILEAFFPEGMPNTVFHEDHWYSPGIEVHGDDLYVTWGFDPAECSSWEKGFGPGVFDSSRWERVKLSEYHAMKEAEEARKE